MALLFHTHLPEYILPLDSIWIPELSLVAVEDEKIVGHILFTKAVVQGVEVLALAPLSVLPDYQNRGIGLSLMKEGHSIAHKLGYEYSVQMLLLQHDIPYHNLLVFLVL